MCSQTLILCCLAAAVSLSVCFPDGAIFFPKDKEDDDVRSFARRKLITTKKIISNGMSIEKCKHYAKYVYENYTDMMGNDISINTCAVVEPLITNGTPALAREFPHMALIGFKVNHPKLNKWKCGGSLISERFVLSAAHCNNLYEESPKWVRLGEYNCRSTADDDENNARPVDYDIIQIIPHPEYDSAKGYNDITLYKLDRDVVFNAFMRPICLHTEHQLPRNYFIITGWGHVSFGETSSGPLLKGNVSFVPGNECGSLLRSALESRESELKDKTMICAANFVSGTDTCQGDSGGPLQYPLEEPYCMYSQVGITSFGVRCGWREGEPKNPAIYTRVSYYVPWIESVVWP